MASMIWVATCGNGARTLTKKIIITLPHLGTPLGPPPLPIRCCAGAVGAAIAACSAPPTAIMTWPPTATWRSDFAVSDKRELIASFHECKPGSPWPSWRPRALATCGSVRKRHGTPRQRGGGNAHDHYMFCSCSPEMDEPHMRACSLHISRGYADQQNSQPVKKIPPSQGGPAGTLTLRDAARGRSAKAQMAEKRPIPSVTACLAWALGGPYMRMTVPPLAVSHRWSVTGPKRWITPAWQ